MDGRCLPDPWHLIQPYPTGERQLYVFSSAKLRRAGGGCCHSPYASASQKHTSSRIPAWTFSCSGCGRDASPYPCRRWHPSPHAQTQVSVQLENAEMMECGKAECETAPVMMPCAVLAVLAAFPPLTMKGISFSFFFNINACA